MPSSRESRLPGLASAGTKVLSTAIRITTTSSGPNCAALIAIFRIASSAVDTWNVSIDLVAERDGHGLGRVEHRRLAVVVEVEHGVALRVPEAEHAFLPRPLPLDRLVVGGGLRAVPAVEKREEDVVGLRLEPDAGHPVRALADGVAGERRPLVGAGRVEADGDGRLADVRIERHEHGPACTRSVWPGFQVLVGRGGM